MEAVCYEWEEGLLKLIWEKHLHSIVVAMVKSYGQDAEAAAHKLE